MPFFDDDQLDMKEEMILILEAAERAIEGRKKKRISYAPLGGIQVARVCTDAESCRHCSNSGVCPAGRNS